MSNKKLKYLNKNLKTRKVKYYRIRSFTSGCDGIETFYFQYYAVSLILYS